MLVPCTSSPVFDMTLAETFEIRLTMDATAVFTGVVPGAQYVLIIQQDGVGDRSFDWGEVVNVDAVNPDPNATTVQTLVGRTDGTLISSALSAVAS